MANEAVKIEGPYNIHDFTVSESVTIEQNTLCQLADPRTAAASSGADIWAGIAATEHEGSKGKTELGLFNTGTFDLKCADGVAIPVGSMVSLSGANLIKLATEAEIVSGAAFGKALETAAEASEDVIEVKLVLQ